MFTYKKIKLFYSSTYFLIFALMTFDIISDLHMQISDLACTPKALYTC